MAARAPLRGARVTRCRTWWLGWGLALLVMAVFCMLGTWQLGRMRLKQVMLDEVAAVMQQRAAAPWDMALARTDGYDWVRGSGTFAEAPALLLDNQMREGRAGVRAYRVFIPDEGTSWPVLVDLGWLPLDDRRLMPDIPRPEGPQWLEGLLAPPPSTGLAQLEGLLAPPPSTGLAQAPAEMQANGTVLTVNLRAALPTPGLTQILGQPCLSERVLRLDPDLPLGYVRDLDILPNTISPERHLGYAVQWYALALTVLVTATLLTFRSLHQ